MKEVVKATCREVLDINVQEEEPVEEKDAKLNFRVKGYKDKISKVKFSYEMKISELQMKMQPATTPEVRE